MNDSADFTVFHWYLVTHLNHDFPLEKRRLGYGASKRHQAGLQVGSPNAYPPLVCIRHIAQLFNYVAKRNALLLYFVHQRDFFRVEFPIPFDFSMLIVHLLLLKMG
jgi:hypothetical protein